MIPYQGSISLSSYSELYDLIVPKDHFLRRLNDLCGNFDFIMDELRDKYCPDNGRMAADPRMLFKYLILKVVYNLSDVDVVEHSRYDMSYKFFLGLAPEDDVIEPSTLCKFRKQRLKDEGLLDNLIRKSVRIALDNGLIGGRDIIIDSTHTRSRANPQVPAEALRRMCRALRKAVADADAAAEAAMPERYDGDDLRKAMEYTERLVALVDTLPASSLPAVYERLNLLRETASDVKDHYDVSRDGDARTGHKTKDSSFFGYKTHLAITQERIVSAAVITSGEKGDGGQRQALSDKSVENGVDVDTVIGDGAYCSNENLSEARAKDVTVVARLNPSVLSSASDDRFTFNKDAGMYVCPSGHMAKRKTVTRDGRTDVYYFDVRKCVVCGRREGCFALNQTSKTFRIHRRTEEQEAQRVFQESREFREKYRTRYKIEAKNADLKNNYGYGRAESYGLVSMNLQGAVTIFAANMRRIVRLIDAKKA